MNMPAPISEADITAALVQKGRVPEGDPDGIGAGIASLLKGEVAMRELRGLSEAQMEAAFAKAYTFFQVGKLENALRLMTFVTMMEHREPRYWNGLGAVRMAMKDYKGAFESYFTAASLDVDAPRAPLRMGECLMALGQQDQARLSLELAIENAGTSAKHAELRDRAETLLRLIEPSEAQVSK